MPSATDALLLKYQHNTRRNNHITIDTQAIAGIVVQKKDRQQQVGKQQFTTLNSGPKSRTNDGMNLTRPCESPSLETTLPQLKEFFSTTEHQPTVDHIVLSLTKTHLRGI